MEFTSQELKHIERLRKLERSWTWSRWVLVGLGIVCLVLSAMFGWLLYSLIFGLLHDQYDTLFVFFIMLIWTKCCIYFVMGVGCLATTWAKWHGDTNRMILLKLLEEQQKKTGRTDAAGSPTSA